MDRGIDATSPLFTSFIGDPRLAAAIAKHYVEKD